MHIRQERHRVVRGGFTLMEVLVVAAILVVLAGAGGVIYMRYYDEAKESRAKLDINTLDQTVQAYKVQSGGDYPLELGVLVQPTPDGKPAALEERALLDPWGQPYQYDPQNRHPLTGKPRIYSLGPRSDGSAPIANW